jgi:hypothetical protein
MDVMENPASPGIPESTLGPVKTGREERGEFQALQVQRVNPGCRDRQHQRAIQALTEQRFADQTRTE